ncbi:MAG: hypothetical protein P4L93_00865 [Coriobacteriia bacterium]|nr:hypothetical protein [Coriobacteriia bacterium]
MDKGLTHFMRGRVRLALLLVVCMVAIVAVPAFAHAAAFSAEYPAPTATLHGQPAVVSVDVAGAAVNPKTATITVNGHTYNAFVSVASASGSWTSTEVLVGTVYKTQWVWGATGAGSTTVSCYPSTLPTGTTINVVMNAADNTVPNAPVALTDSWSFTIAVNGTPVTPPAGSVYNNAICTTYCHTVGGTAIGVTGNHAKDYVNDNAMGPDCYSCHQGAAAPVHGVPTSASMVGNHLTVQSEIAANSAGCVSCHGSDLLSVATKNADGTYTVPAVGGATEHQGCSCHEYHEASGKMACEGCHVKPMDPTAAYPYHVGAHDALQAGIGGTKSSACVTCHGSDLLNVAAGPMTQGAHANCVCHAQGVATSATTECVSCHTGGDAAHGFANGLTHGGGGWIAASGHNTTTYNGFGGLSKFDGSQGVTLQDTSGATVLSTWATPTVNVFNPSAKDAQGNALGWNSIVTCQDCHTGLNAAGPHGAAQNWGIDPNYPAPYNMAVNSHATESGMAERSGTPTFTATQVSGPMADLTGFGNGANTASYRDSKLAAAGLADASNAGTANAVICAKCHKLFDFDNAYTAGNYTAGSHGYGYVNATGIGNASNTAHSSHHWDLNNGAADCVSCHVGLPHGWMRPRLLVNSYNGPYTVTVAGVDTTATSVADPPPYLDSSARLMTPTTGTNLIPRGMGPLSTVDQHTLVNGGATWTEADCLACAGSGASGLEHTGDAKDAKLK